MSRFSARFSTACLKPPLELLEPTQQLIEPLCHWGRLLLLLDEEGGDVYCQHAEQRDPGDIKKAAIPLPAGVTGNMSP